MTLHQRTHGRVRALRAALAAVTLCLAAAACEPTPPEEPPPTTAPIPAPNGDIGWEGPSYEGASGSPSGSKPESKLWWNDGAWWADLWDVGTGDFYIHRLDLATHQWVRTATRLDDRSNSRSDTLWDGTHLYVASHAFAEGASTTPSAPSELRRFSYDAGSNTYQLDAGFPVQINDARSETLVIERDSSGRLWATWTEDRQVMVAVSSVGGASWGAPYALPVSGSHVASDDVSSVVAFGGDRIGVMWSNQDEDTMYFSVRSDSAGTGTWGPAEIAYRGTSAADDHINLKNVADTGGRVLAAVKTSQTGSAPLVHLLDRATDGTWSSHVFGLGSDNHTRPIVVIDRQHAVVHMFATSGQSGGSIYRKTARLSALSFTGGKGTAVLTDADAPDINNATSTKQSVDATSGLVVLATNDTTRRYWTHFDPLGGSGSTATTTTSTSSTTTSTTSTTSTTTPGPTTTIAFTAVADAKVSTTDPGRAYGGTTDLRVRDGDPAYRSYLRFTPSGLAGPATRAILRLWVTDPSRSAGTVATTSSSWSEATITGGNAPPPGTTLRAVGATTTGTWAEVDVTAAVVGDGPVSFAISGSSTDNAVYDSREAAHPPQLVITSGSPA